MDVAWIKYKITLLGDMKAYTAMGDKEEDSVWVWKRVLIFWCFRVNYVDLHRYEHSQNGELHMIDILSFMEDFPT